MYSASADSLLVKDLDGAVEPLLKIAELPHRSKHHHDASVIHGRDVMAGGKLNCLQRFRALLHPDSGNAFHIAFLHNGFCYPRRHDKHNGLHSIGKTADIRIASVAFHAGMTGMDRVDRKLLVPKIAIDDVTVLLAVVGNANNSIYR